MEAFEVGPQCAHHCWINFEVLPMNQLLQYKCCFCGNAGQVMYEMPDDPTLSQSAAKMMAVVKAKIACQPCYRFERSRRDIGRAIQAKGVKFDAIGLSMRHELEQDYRQSMSILLHKFCACFEKRFGLPPLFEPGMVDAVVSRPSYASNVLARITNLARERVVK